MKILKTNKGIDTVVDDSSYELFRDKNLLINKDGYVVFNSNNKRFFMHRIICNTPDGFFTDHINGNKLDNLNTNLRVCSTKENVRNSGIRVDNTSGYKGVSYRKDRKTYSVEISKDGKRKRLGCFKNLEKAALAYNTAAIELFGEFARLNEIK